VRSASAGRGVAATFAVEQLMVLMLGAVIGVAAGVGLMGLMLPFLQLGETTDELVPSVILELDPLTLGLYLATVSALVVISVVWSTRRVSARRLSEVLREVDR
jgi:ABC-type antimicrobial peptide transport system permease subunit